jgi:Uma2 family endonuclease
MHAPPEAGPSGRQKELAAKLLFDTRWSEKAYLALAELNRHVEYSDGRLLIHEMPTPEHQRIVRNLARRLQDWAEARRAGEVLFAPMPVRLWPGKFREPDVVFYAGRHRARIGSRFAGVPDLAVEVLSETTEAVDREEKLTEYARAGILEYWIADPRERTVTRYVLAERRYREAERVSSGGRLATSLLPGCEIRIDDVFPRTR